MIFHLYDYSVRTVGSVFSLSPCSTYSFTALHNSGCFMWILGVDERRGGSRIVRFKTTPKRKNLFYRLSDLGIYSCEAHGDLGLGLGVLGA